MCRLIGGALEGQTILQGHMLSRVPLQKLGRAHVDHLRCRTLTSERCMHELAKEYQQIFKLLTAVARGGERGDLGNIIAKNIHPAALILAILFGTSGNLVNDEEMKVSAYSASSLKSEMIIVAQRGGEKIEIYYARGGEERISGLLGSLAGLCQKPLRPETCP